ncbi:right-handed parallel beta-helix repeat-containing protein [Clostridium tarantellae]|nr:right-handed parallel beta-helix repeat-containing protein [Clostridium tarantellae]
MYKNNNYKNFIIFILSFIFIILFSQNVKAIEKNNQNLNEKIYTIELERFRIKNDGTSPIETSKGINKALQFAKQQKYEKVIFPNGIYLIDENNPIILDMQNMIIDLNSSTLQINTNGLEKYSILQFRNGAENLRLTNGNVRGDKDTHDYKTIAAPHEWGCGVVFQGGFNLIMDNVTVSNVTGYGISTESANNANRFHEVSTKNLEFGNILNKGEFVTSNQTIRTKTPYDISKVGTEFELGYTLGYQGYPVLKSKEYTAYFYDKDMKFIEAKQCIQYRKVTIPKNSVYVNFTFNQNVIPNNTQNWAGWISNFKPPTNVTLKDCIIKENRSLGLAFCGGQKWIIENNLFQGNGGNAPGYAVDFEDGWELMQDIVFRNNTFKNNDKDLVVCAGDNIVFEGNDFTSMVYAWGRTTNYKFLNNKFYKNYVTYENTTNMESTGNEYNKSIIKLYDKNKDANTLIHKEIFNESSIYASEIYNTIVDSTINGNHKDSKDYVWITGDYKGCNINVKGAYMDANLYNCNFNNANIYLKTANLMKECNIKNSHFMTHGDTKNLTINSSKLENSKFYTSTWGNETIINMQANEILMNSGSESLINISAGKMKNLIFENNSVENLINKPVFNMFDTTYSIPKGNFVIQNNKINQNNYKFIFDGVDIKQGVFNFTERNNSVNGAQMLNPKYINNQYFKITN